MEQAMRDKFEAWVTAAMGGYADLRKSNDPNSAATPSTCRSHASAPRSSTTAMCTER